MKQRIDADTAREATVRYLTRMLSHARDELIVLEEDLREDDFRDGDIRQLLMEMQGHLHVHVKNTDLQSNTTRWVSRSEAPTHLHEPKVLRAWHDFSRGKGR